MQIQIQKPSDKPAVQKRANKTGIPNDLKSRYENMSGLSFDDVRVHYNSDKPAQLQALAYTQGNQVYVAPNQEKHLAHELGHVVQQKQGLVCATDYINGLPVNTNEALERQADSKSIQFFGLPKKTNTSNVVQKFGTKELSDHKLTTEPDVVAATDEQEVVLARGVRAHRVIECRDPSFVRGSFVSLTKMFLSEGMEDDLAAPKPEEARAHDYVTKAADVGLGDLIEFTTSETIAKNYAEVGGYIIYVKIKKKYITKAPDSKAEFGWIAKQNAPYKIVKMQVNLETGAPKELDDAQIDEKLQDEKDALFFDAFKKKDVTTDEVKVDLLTLRLKWYDRSDPGKTNPKFRQTCEGEIAKLRAKIASKSKK